VDPCIENTAMIPVRFSAAVLIAASLATVAPAQAASLEAVPEWGATGVPTSVSMSIYVPDNVAETPPILVLIHYCGGDAGAVFGQARGGGIVAAADQYGFIMVVPSAKNSDGTGRCWDVQSDQTRTRDGGGDSQAIRQMVTYAVSMRGGNADRVYATGDSSGGMMTELLLGLYPDVFKAGAAMAGMPAGCRGNNENGNGGGYSGACAGGSVMRTPEEWGNIVRMMHPGYTGHRPRVQLFHGDADTLIRPANHTEAIKEWTNVLGLTEAPTMTDMGVDLGNHQATRQRWENSCGIVVLDAFMSLGGDHGPSDALFLAEYIVPFLGLDQTGPVDPEVAACPSNSGGAGGMGAGGMSGGASGAGAAGAGGAGAAGAAGMASGGALAAGGGGSGGSVGLPGGSGSGGAAGFQATSGSGGAGGTSGAPGSGGMPGSGGTASGAAAGMGTSGAPGAAGTTSTPTPVEDGGGCACAVGKRRSQSGWAALALGLLVWSRARRRNRPPS
jgi:acetylxylan esterase